MKTVLSNLNIEDITISENDKNDFIENGTYFALIVCVTASLQRLLRIRNFLVKDLKKYKKDQNTEMEIHDEQRLFICNCFIQKRINTIDEDYVTKILNIQGYKK